jgi:membrane fusion protein, multidrug efflux system
MRVAPLVLLAILAACRKPAGDESGAIARPDAPISVQTTPVAERPIPEYLVLTGTLRAMQESEVAADAAGKVTQTFVERGQHVKRGDIVATLDSRGASITATAMMAQSNLARAQVDQAQKECDRVKSLKESGAISQAEFERVTSQCQTTQFSAAAAAAQQQNAQKIVGDAIIRAPFEGVVGERFVSVGQYVQPSTRVLSLYAPDPLRLELTVPEANVSGLAAEMPVEFTVATHGDKKFTGAVKLISPNVRPQTRDLVIEAFCPNADGRLRPGMFAVARLAVGEKPMVSVPEASLKKDATSERVFVVHEKRIQERIVQTAGERGGNVGIVAGVKVGENVVVNPGADVRDGAPVK